MPVVGAIRESFLEVGGARLHCAVGPENGPPLLLLHGVTRCWQSFLPLLPTLGLRWHVHALDLRGHGRSSHTPDAYQVKDYVQEAVALVRSHFKKPLVIYGHSLGAMVAAAAAAQCPQLVRAAVLEDPPFDTMGRRIGQTPLFEYFRELHALVQQGLDVPALARRMDVIRMTDPRSGHSVRLGAVRDAAALRFHAACLTRMDRGILAPVVEQRWLDGFVWQETLPDIRCPTLLLQADGASGGMLTEDDADCCVVGMRDCVLVRMPGVGHMIHATRTPEALNVIVPFLESL